MRVKVDAGHPGHVDDDLDRWVVDEVLKAVAAGADRDSFACAYRLLDGLDYLAGVADDVDEVGVSFKAQVVAALNQVWVSRVVRGHPHRPQWWGAGDGGAGRRGAGMRATGMTAAGITGAGVPALDIVVLGLSITSSWGNGHATTYRGLVRELAAAGRGVLLSSHLLGELELVCTHVVLLAEGRVLESGTLDEVVGQHAGLEDAFLAHVQADAEREADDA